MARRDLSGAIDFQRLEAYAADDAQVVEEVLALFVEQAEVWARLLDPSAGAAGFRDAAHTLKGAALGLGADALAAACGAAEAGAQASVGERTVLAAHVRDALAAALSDVAAYRHERLLRELKSPL